MKSEISAAQGSAATADTSQAISLADPQNALNQFQIAADRIEQQYPGALSAFQQYVSGGSKAALDQNTQAQLATLPVSDTAKTALDELRGFMGLPSISPTAGLSAQVNGMINQLQNDPNATDQVNQLQSLRDQLAQAEDFQDPEQRELARSQITEQLTDMSGQMPESLQPAIQSITNQFNVGYGAQAGNSAWSPEVIQAKLEADPNYQFRMNQGMKAIERTAAAKGNLLSGNTLAAAQEYGQGLASQAYQQRINQLQNLATSTQGGINNQAGILQNAGAQMAQTGQQVGAAAGDIYKGIAGAGQQAAQQSGQALLNANQLQSQTAQQGILANAQMQQQANMQNAQLQQQANMANQQAGNSPGLITSLIGAL